jgi:Zn-finger domain-containing protein
VARLFSDDDIEEQEEPSPVRLPPSLWARLSEIAHTETERAKVANKKAKTISRNSVIKRVLRNFVEQYEAEETDKRSRRGGH